jgi:hypothetical protein
MATKYNYNAIKTIGNFLEVVGKHPDVVGKILATTPTFYFFDQQCSIAFGRISFFG